MHYDGDRVHTSIDADVISGFQRAHADTAFYVENSHLRFVLLSCRQGIIRDLITRL
jgi:hypothetical protein